MARERVGRRRRGDEAATPGEGGSSRRARATASEVSVRWARRDEGGTLSALAFRSKSSWGYDREFMEACRAELTVSGESIESGDVRVLELAGRVAGYYSFAPGNSGLELSHFFIDPAAMGRGAGRTLWLDAVDQARRRGASHLLIQSDPYAEGFYLKLGAERIGEVPSQARPGRLLPLLLYPLAGSEGTHQP